MGAGKTSGTSKTLDSTPISAAERRYKGEEIASLENKSLPARIRERKEAKARGRNRRKPLSCTELQNSLNAFQTTLGSTKNVVIIYIYMLLF